MPRRALYYIDNHKIEIVRTFFGMEKVLLNRQKVSEQKAKAGGEHSFAIDGNRYQITHRNGLGTNKFEKYEIRKNGSPLALVNAVQQNSLRILLLIVAVGLGSGFIFGVILYKFFFPVSA